MCILTKATVLACLAVASERRRVLNRNWQATHLLKLLHRLSQHGFRFLHKFTRNSSGALRTRLSLSSPVTMARTMCPCNSVF